MKILILDNSVAFTGAFKCALNEARLLSDSYQFVFVLPAGSAVVQVVADHGFPVYTLPLKEISRSPKALVIYPFFLLKNIRALKKIIREEKVDVVQINDFYNLLGAGLKLTGYRGKVLTWVRFLPEVIPSVLRSLWIGAAQRYSYRVIAVSNAVLKQLPPSEKNLCLYDPVLLSEQYPSREENTDQTVQLLYLANFTRGKGQEHAVEAFAKAFKKNPQLRLLFAGGDMGKDKNRDFRLELIDRVERLGLSKEIKFKDFVEDVEAEIKAADILLNFSEGESFSMTCLEASFYGTPVIATRCGGPEEIIQPRETGWLVPRGDHVAMSEAILHLAEDAALRKAFADKARLFVRNKFKPAIFKQKLFEILQ